MITPSLHKNAVALDREAHKGLRIRKQQPDWSISSGMNACFVNVVEFADVGKDYPIVFVPAGTDPASGKREVAPMAVLGLTAGENLYADGLRWNAGYIPALLRLYPFALARVAEDRYAVCIDRAWAGFSETEGDPLFDQQGQPSAHVQEVQKLLEQMEMETQRTRAVCTRLLELDLLHEMRVDATLRDGQTMTVDGFLGVDEKKFGALPDATVVELHRQGLLGLMTLQMASMGHIRRLFDRRAQLKANA